MGCVSVLPSEIAATAVSEVFLYFPFQLLRDYLASQFNSVAVHHMAASSHASQNNVFIPTISEQILPGLPRGEQFREAGPRATLPNVLTLAPDYVNAVELEDEQREGKKNHEAPRHPAREGCTLLLHRFRHHAACVVDEEIVDDVPKIHQKREGQVVQVESQVRLLAVIHTVQCGANEGKPEEAVPGRKMEW